MPSVANFIRNTPAASLRTYFERAGIDIPIKIDWDGPERDIVRPLLQLVDEMDETALARVVNDAERVTKMADEAGQNALFGVVADRTTLDDLSNAHDRALWMFLNDPTGFLRAEEVRFTDERRRLAMRLVAGGVEARCGRVVGGRLSGLARGLNLARPLQVDLGPLAGQA